MNDWSDKSRLHAASPWPAKNSAWEINLAYAPRHQAQDVGLAELVADALASQTHELSAGLVPAALH